MFQFMVLGSIPSLLLSDGQLGWNLCDGLIYQAQLADQTAFSFCLVGDIST